MHIHDEPGSRLRFWLNDLDDEILPITPGSPRETEYVVVLHGRSLSRKDCLGRW